jgi:hypothetical protein
MTMYCWAAAQWPHDNYSSIGAISACLLRKIEDSCKPASAVIPEQAGIQGRNRSKTYTPTDSHQQIPAFAGMMIFAEVSKIASKGAWNAR